MFVERVGLSRCWLALRPLDSEQQGRDSMLDLKLPLLLACSLLQLASEKLPPHSTLLAQLLPSSQPVASGTSYSPSVRYPRPSSYPHLCPCPWLLPLAPTSQRRVSADPPSAARRRRAAPLQCRMRVVECHLLRCLVKESERRLEVPSVGELASGRVGELVELG